MKFLVAALCPSFARGIYTGMLKAVVTQLIAGSCLQNLISQISSILLDCALSTPL